MYARFIPPTMKAVGFYQYLPISEMDSLVDLVVDVPTLGNTEVLVQVKAVSLNPIDAKIRSPKPEIELRARILGWDGAGVVVQKGSRVKLFKIGDEVYFTVNLMGYGANAEFVAVEEDLVYFKPKNMPFEEAAAMPFTTVTAYEALFHRLNITEKDKNKSLLIINSAGGVGSIAIQLAKVVGLTVIGTASRHETEIFATKNGADAVVNHSKELVPQMEAKGYGLVDFILVNYDPYLYWESLSKIIKPFGKICLLVECSGLVNITQMMDKSVTLVYESIYTRAKYGHIKMNTHTHCLIKHGDILKELSKLLEEGKIKSTLTKVISPLNAANLREAHSMIEEKKIYGKLVIYINDLQNQV